MKLRHIDNEREFDWGRTSDDYAAFRGGYPEIFYDTLATLGIGVPDQRILDLGTGTGVLARAFAKRGADVSALDIAENQIRVAKTLAEDAGLDIDFRVVPAEDVDFPDSSFDVVSAGQSWLYFDKSTVIPKVLRLLDTQGCLLLTHLLWLPHKDLVAGETEKLVLAFNPDWNSAGYDGNMPPVLEWSKEHFRLRTFHTMESPIAFNRESWRGRIRACRGIGASLNDDEIRSFDEKLERLLKQIAADEFSVLHQMTIHIFEAI